MEQDQEARAEGWTRIWEGKRIWRSWQAPGSNTSKQFFILNSAAALYLFVSVRRNKTTKDRLGAW